MFPSARAPRAHLSSVCSCFVSLHFTDNVVDLVSSVAVGLTFKDLISSQRFVWFAMFCRQTEAVKRKVRNLRQNTCQLKWRITQTLENVNLHMVGCPLRKFFFALLKVSGNRQSFAVLLFHQRKINASLARKVAVSKFK